jgi:hypothetical protein
MIVGKLLEVVGRLTLAGKLLAGVTSVVVGIVVDKLTSVMTE